MDCPNTNKGGDLEFRQPRGKPEAEGASRLKALMKKEGWKIYRTHGNLYQRDFPDLYCLHKIHGQRWVETKSPTGKLSIGQGRQFGEWAGLGVGVWVLRDEKDYQWLFKEANWWRFV